MGEQAAKLGTVKWPVRLGHLAFFPLKVLGPFIGTRLHIYLVISELSWVIFPFQSPTAWGAKGWCLLEKGGIKNAKISSTSNSILHYPSILSTPFTPNSLSPQPTGTITYFPLARYSQFFECYHHQGEGGVSLAVMCFVDSPAVEVLKRLERQVFRWSPPYPISISPNGHSRIAPALYNIERASLLLSSTLAYHLLLWNIMTLY